MPSPYAQFGRIPDPWRGWIGLRRARRWVRAVRFARRHKATQGGDSPTFSFYPMRAEPTAAIAFVVARLGARIVAFGRPADLTFAWHTGTWLSVTAANRLPVDALNRRCLDISKTRVDRVWEVTSGYSISIDPYTTHGPLVVKPDQNGVRRGRIVEGPVRSTRPGFVYQRIVDSRDGDRIHSLRAVILNGRILLTYEKWRPYPFWFKGPELTLPGVTRKIFSAEEEALLLRFAAAIGMDYGELDVLRDNESRLIYVVDANRTPVRPKGLPVACEDASFGPMAEAFAELLQVRHG